MRHVGNRHRFLIDAVLADVADDADDVEPLGLAVVPGAERQALSHRILPRPLAPGHRFVDHGRAGIEDGVARHELATLHHGDAEGGKEAR